MLLLHALAFSCFELVFVTILLTLCNVFNGDCRYSGDMLGGSISGGEGDRCRDDWTCNVTMCFSLKRRPIKRSS